MLTIGPLFPLLLLHDKYISLIPGQIDILILPELAFAGNTQTHTHTYHHFFLQSEYNQCFILFLIPEKSRLQLSIL